MRFYNILTIAPVILELVYYCVKITICHNEVNIVRNWENLLLKKRFYDITYTRDFIGRYGGRIMSTNLSKIKRDKMLDTISKIKENVNDEETLKNLSLIEYELTKKKYGLVWEEHEEKVDEELKTQIPTFEEVTDKEIVSNNDDKFN